MFVDAGNTYVNPPFLFPRELENKQEMLMQGAPWLSPGELTGRP